MASHKNNELSIVITSPMLNDLSLEIICFLQICKNKGAACRLISTFVFFFSGLVSLAYILETYS